MKRLEERVFTLQDPPRAGVRAYLVAAGALGAALLLRLALDPLWGERLPYVTFFLAVLALCIFVDVGPAVFAIVAGFILGDWFFAAPRHSLAVAGAVNQANAGFYFLVCSTVLYFSHRARRALALQRKAQATLTRLAAIIESSDDAIIGKTLEGKITTWNAGAQKLYGYTDSEIVGQSISVLMPAERGQELAPMLERVARGEPIQHFETLRRRKDGTLVEVSLSISPVRDGAGTIVGASTIARDVTERARAARERERLLDQLQAALNQVKTLSGLLPICSQCKKIRDDKGKWTQIEHYIRARSEADFTHSICPECAAAYYPEFYPKK